MPQPSELPDDLQTLAYRNALIVNNDRFSDDGERLVAAVQQVMESARVERQKEQLEAVKKLVVSVQGIVSQYRGSTVQAVIRQFNAYCGQPWMGASNSTRILYLPKFCVDRWEPSDAFARDFRALGFAEVFWTDTATRAAGTKTTTEDTKAWAQTIVERVRRLDELGSGQSDLIDYRKASAVVDELIGTVNVLENLLSIPKKTGFIDFNLGNLLADFRDQH